MGDRQPWPDDVHAKVLALAQKGVSTASISAQTGVPQTTISEWRSGANVMLPLRRAWSESEVDRLKERVASGDSIADIAMALGRRPAGVSGMLRKLAPKAAPQAQDPPIRRRQPSGRCSVALPADVFAALSTAAADRKMDPQKLAALLLQTILRDQLIAAVLDTDEAPASKPRAAIPKPAPARAAFTPEQPVLQASA